MNAQEIKFFDDLSARWDDDEILSTPEKITEILLYLDIRRGMDILDLGTGTGVLLPYLAEAVGPEGRITAVDISTGMLSKAIGKYGTLENIDFVNKDFETETIAGHYDLILLYSVYPHLHTPEKTLTTLMRTNMRTDGKIVIAFPTDETFINNIHRDRKAESDMLPPAEKLAQRIGSWGLRARPVACCATRYIVTISQ